MTLERETKLRAPATFALPQLSDVPGVVAMPSESRRFLTCTWTRRTCGSRGGAACGTAGRGLDAEAAEGPERRDDRPGRARVRGGRAPGAGEASDLVAAYSRGAELRPVVRLRTLRRRIELADEGARRSARWWTTRSR